VIFLGDGYYYIGGIRKKNPIKRGSYWKKMPIMRGIGDFFIKKIFFGRKIPRVEPGRASIHGTSVPGMEGGVRT
jgi:hypothetical protein